MYFAEYKKALITLAQSKPYNITPSADDLKKGHIVDYDPKDKDAKVPN